LVHAAEQLENVPSQSMCATHAPSPDLQSSATGQSLPVPDFATVWVNCLVLPLSHAAVQLENIPSQSMSAVVGDDVGIVVGEDVGIVVGDNVGRVVGEDVGTLIS